MAGRGRTPADSCRRWRRACGVCAAGIGRASAGTDCADRPCQRSAASGPSAAAGIDAIDGADTPTGARSRRGVGRGHRTRRNGLRHGVRWRLWHQRRADSRGHRCGPTGAQLCPHMHRARRQPRCAGASVPRLSPPPPPPPPGPARGAGGGALERLCGALQRARGRPPGPPPSHAPADEASAWGACRVHAVRAQLESAWDLPFKAQRHYLETVLAELPDALFAGDSTQPVYQGNLAIDMPGPRRWFNSSTGYGTLGYGLPAAIGAQLAAPDRPVVCLIGDGGLQFTLPELASAVEAGLAPIILLWNNGGYEEIRRYMRQRDIRPIPSDLYTPPFHLLARGFGCDACRADDAAALRRALRQARSGTRDRPVLIETSQAHWHAHAYAADRQTATAPPGPLHGDTDA